MGIFDKCSIENINEITSRSIYVDKYGKKKIWYPVNKETVHQFHVGYMTHPLMKKHRAIREKVIKFFQLESKLVTLKFIIIELLKKCICSFIDIVL